MGRGGPCSLGVEVVVLVEDCWWVWIFDSFGFFGGGCGCVEGCWWWWLWLWISGLAVGGGGAGFEEQKRKGTQVITLFFCVVSMGGSIILAKSEVKN